MAVFLAECHTVLFIGAGNTKQNKNNWNMSRNYHHIITDKAQILQKYHLFVPLILTTLLHVGLISVAYLTEVNME